MQQPEDIVRDILDRLHEAFAAGKPIQDAEFWIQVETEIRRDWGGDRAYIAKTGESQIKHLGNRDRAIVRDHKRGESVAFLARRWQLSRVRIRQIINSARRENALP
jgi:Mor family transcriptional regulator